LVVVHKSNIYIAAEVGSDILFTNGAWWWLYEGQWYKSYFYAGPWQ